MNKVYAWILFYALNCVIILGLPHYFFMGLVHVKNYIFESFDTVYAGLRFQGVVLFQLGIRSWVASANCLLHRATFTTLGLF